mmetsp:Transcript_25126/g.79129  ORF Transcript_25126/g.79129 Transcript_25126/m.79129 type:complete len:225 (+) Transcript_25126:416-1090(+)
MNTKLGLASVGGLPEAVDPVLHRVVEGQVRQVFAVHQPGQVDAQCALEGLESRLADPKARLVRLLALPGAVRRHQRCYRGVLWSAPGRACGVAAVEGAEGVGSQRGPLREPQALVASSGELKPARLGLADLVRLQPAAVLRVGLHEGEHAASPGEERRAGLQQQHGRAPALQQRAVQALGWHGALGSEALGGEEPAVEVLARGRLRGRPRAPLQLRADDLQGPG